MAAASLQRMYNSGDGLFCRKPDPNCWWDSANELTSLIDYSRQTGILTEPCKTSDCGAKGNGPSMLQYKGIFMRNLYCLNQTARVAAFRTFITGNARSIFARDQNGDRQFGFRWAGGWDARNGATEATEGSALSGLNANVTRHAANC